jgi:AcrR family transcriptional regulator
MKEQNKSMPLRGRPRSEEAHQAILKAALALVSQIGFRTLTVDAIAAKAGVGKMTVYRRWPNKAAVVMDAFLLLVGPGTDFPPNPRAVVRIKLQMRLQAKFFRSKSGLLIKALLGEAQFDAELAEAFRERWLMPRRLTVKQMIADAIKQGDVRPDIDPDAAIDMLYGPIYYRFQTGSGPLDDSYTDVIFNQVMQGLRATRSTADV